jgi:hypothetical protein
MADMLCRFFEHDDRNDGITWTVSGGWLEGTKRYYRTMYDNSITKLERELVINTKSEVVEDILEFKRIVRAWASTDDFVKQFEALCMVDPWLSKYTDESIYILQEPLD